MRMIVRRDPWMREMAAWRNVMDRFLEDALEGPFSEGPTAWSLALDVAETEYGYIVKASVPGIKPEDLDITISDNVLTIKGEIAESEEIENGEWHLRERRFGNFQRSITLPAPVDADAVEAHYAEGVLTLEIPKVEEAQPKRIEVKAE